MALSQPQLIELKSQMEQKFSLEEVKSLCFEMGIDFESLPGEGKGAKIRELIAFCQRRGRTEELAERVRAERPPVAPPGATAPQASGGGSQYNYSAHAEGGGTATTTNYIGAPPQAAQPSVGVKQQVGSVASGGTVIGVQIGTMNVNRPLQPEEKITILFLAANPKGTDRLRLDEEVRTIDERLRLAQYRDKFNLEQQWAVRTRDILDAMLRYKPDIVHFSGHGSPDGALIFEDASGAATPVSAAALGALFHALEGVRCVVLNACWSNTHATQIAKHVDCVIGMARSVSDDAAIGFAAGFYRSLGEGKSVGKAFDLGKVQIMLDGRDEKSTPRLKSRSGVKPGDVTFA
jgi:hypothetical protein